MRWSAAALIAAALAVGLFAVGPGRAAAAPGNPSAGQIVHQLEPKTLKETLRGLHLLKPGEDISRITVLRCGGGRGIRLLRPAPGGLTTTTRCIRVPSPSVSLNVEFATGSARLTGAARATLGQLGAALANPALAGSRFRLEGHTDTVGTAAYNLALSQRRADAVAAYLETRFGVAPARLLAVGVGERGLLVPTPPQTPEARNRRVLVVNLGR